MKLARAALRGQTLRAACAGALLAGVASGAIAHAESARRVVLVVPEAPGAVATEALARVRGELQAARFEVESEVVGNNVDRRATVERALRKADARAAFGIFFGSGVAEIWVSDGVSGRTVVQSLPLSAAAPERRAAVLAVKAVDLLKATLAEVWVAAPILPPPPSSPPAPAPSLPPPAPPVSVAPPAPAPPVIRPTSPPAPRAELVESERRSTPMVTERLTESAGDEQPSPPLGRRVDFAIGAGWIGAGSVSSWAPLVALSAFSGHLGGRLVATGFGSSSEVTQTPGSASVAYGLALAELAVRQPFGTHFETTASLSAGSARLAVDGSGAIGTDGHTLNVGHTQDVWSAVGGGGVGAAVLISRFTVAVDARVLVSATEAHVLIGASEVLQLGRPLFSVGGSLGVRL